MSTAFHVLLICTVGSRSEPNVVSIKHWQPSRVVFVHSPETKANIDNQILPTLERDDLRLAPGQCEFFEIADKEDFAGCIDQLRELTAEVISWVTRGAGYQVVVDFTGGTKCMSAALAVHATRWPCSFSYVGGDERDRGGVGVVVSGSENVVHSVNPWDALGYQTIEQFLTLFDEYAFGSAARVADEAKRRVSREDRKREFAVLANLAKAFDAWERFDHGKAATMLREVDKQSNDLRAVLGVKKGNTVLRELTRLASHLAKLDGVSGPTRDHIVDLLGNAQRRWREGRFDDAVARLYRAIEATAQLRLAEGYGIKTTEGVPLERLPAALRARWETRAEDGHVRLGLQDAYALLSALGDPLGEEFRKRKLHERESDLSARNRSILAHGFERVSEKVCDKLWRVALDLAGVQEGELPVFPKLLD